MLSVHKVIAAFPGRCIHPCSPFKEKLKNPFHWGLAWFQKHLGILLRGRQEGNFGSFQDSCFPTAKARAGKR